MSRGTPEPYQCGATRLVDSSSRERIGITGFPTCAGLGSHQQRSTSTVRVRQCSGWYHHVAFRLAPIPCLSVAGAREASR